MLFPPKMCLPLRFWNWEKVECLPMCKQINEVDIVDTVFTLEYAFIEFH